MRAGVTDDVVMDVIAVDHAVADVVSADVAESKVAAAAVAYTGENSVQGAWRAFSGIAMAAVVLVIIALFGVGIWMVITWSVHPLNAQKKRIIEDIDSIIESVSTKKVQLRK